MTKDEYIRWKATDPADQTRADCIAADQLIRRETMAKFQEIARKWTMPDPARRFLCTSVSTHFWSVEVQELLTELGCYPDWM